MFGEKYDEAGVRVVDVPGVSMELCGGTHVTHTAQVRYGALPFPECKHAQYAPSTFSALPRLAHPPGHSLRFVPLCSSRHLFVSCRPISGKPLPLACMRWTRCRACHGKGGGGRESAPTESANAPMPCSKPLNEGLIQWEKLGQ